MTALPVSMAWLIIAIFIALPLLCAVAAVEASHFYTWAYRKDMEARERAVGGLAGFLQRRAEALDERENAVDERENAVDERELALGRRAHDAATQAKAALYQASVDDTEIAWPKLEL